MNVRLTHAAEKQMERRFDAQREAEKLTGLIAAEFRSDHMSVQCFDLRVVERVKACADAFKANPDVFSQ